MFKRIVLLILAFIAINKLIAQTEDTLFRQLKSAEMQAGFINAVFKQPAQYKQISKTKFGYWGLGNFEEAAFIKDDIVIAVFSAGGFVAPPVFIRPSNYNPDKWIRNLNNRFDSIALSNTDSGFTCKKVSKGELKKINADRGYIFNKNPKSVYLYRNKYTRAKLIFLQKDDLGRILFAYYYNPKDEERVSKEIKKNWEMLIFKDDKGFYRDQSGSIGQKSIYLGKFAYANDPEDVKKDSLLFEQRKQQVSFGKIIEHGKQLFNEKKFRQATDTFQRALSLNPRLTDASVSMIFSFTALQQFDSAWHYLEAIKKRQPGFEGYNYIKASLYMFENKKDSAFAIFDKLSDSSRSWKSAFDYAKIYAKEKYFSKALVLFHKADSLFLKASPVNSQFFKRLQKSYGEIQFNIGITMVLLAEPGATNKEAARSYFIKARENGFSVPDAIKREFNL